MRAGESLQAIAQSLYGDASLWYKLAEANGLSAASGLIEGQTLILPAGVMRSTHNASTFTPYNPADATGDLSPTTPANIKPPKKNKCGMLGMILLAVVAIAVMAGAAGAGSVPPWGRSKVGLVWALTALTPFGAAGASIAGIGFGTTAAAGAWGTVSSAAAKGVGVVTGLQNKFSWSGSGTGRYWRSNFI